MDSPYATVQVYDKLLLPDNSLSIDIGKLQKIDQGVTETALL